MASNWQVMPFSQAVTVNPRVQLKRGAVYPFVDMGAIKSGSRSAFSSEERKFDVGGSRFAVGDTLMARITPCLENGKISRFAGKSGEIAHGSTEFIVIRGREGVSETDYAYYLTKWDGVSGYAISQMTGTSGRQRVPSESLDHLEVPIPPLPEQRAIAHILGTLDDKIELNRRMNETLEGMARALFKSWFVDFDPVRAKAAGRDPALPKEIAALFPDSFQDSELGEIPKGWEVMTIGEHMVNFDSKRVPVSGAQRTERQGLYPYHGAAGVMDYVDDFLFDGIHLLVGEDGSVVQNAGLAVTQYVWGKIWVNNHAHVLQGTHAVSTEQLYLYFQFEPVAPFVTGAVQPKLSQGRMNSMPFVYSGDAVCQAFGQIIKPWFAKLRANVDETNTLAALRDALLPKLISGELRVNKTMVMA